MPSPADGDAVANAVRDTARAPGTDGSGSAIAEAVSRDQREASRFRFLARRETLRLARFFGIAPFDAARRRTLSAVWSAVAVSSTSPAASAARALLTVDLTRLRERRLRSVRSGWAPRVRRAGAQVATRTKTPISARASEGESAVAFGAGAVMTETEEKDLAAIDPEQMVKLDAYSAAPAR